MAGLYDYRWQQARKRFLAEHPLCAYCERDGRLTPATVVDHITPHRDDPQLFWDFDNWQPLCKQHHDATKQREDHGKFVGCDASGRPLSAAHWWNKA